MHRTISVAGVIPEISFLVSHVYIIKYIIEFCRTSIAFSFNSPNTDNRPPSPLQPHCPVVSLTLSIPFLHTVYLQRRLPRGGVWCMYAQRGLVVNVTRVGCYIAASLQQPCGIYSIAHPRITKAYIFFIQIYLKVNGI